MTYKGKAIYNPSGKAGEYSDWACNFYVGCSNECNYCYLKKGRGAAILGGNIPMLKKCFKNEEHALEIFMDEVAKNEDEVRKHGLFFSFTTDPMLTETITLTLDAVEACNSIGIPVKILTKKSDFFSALRVYEENAVDWNRSIIAFGFTLTGHDELESNANTNEDRIYAMSQLKYNGYKTFASIEPIIDFESTKEMIGLSMGFCDLFKVGLESGKKYNIVEAQTFVEWLDEFEVAKIYMKESLQKLVRYSNSDMDKYFVEHDYNIFS